MRLEGSRVKCTLCPHGCVIAPGKRGRCGVRENRSGVLHTLSYRRVIAEHVDPIEKKPLYHFLPGSVSYSIATMGCNFSCLHCQNWEISQVRGEIEGYDLPPEEVVERALSSNCSSISYTYTEPTVFAEYVLECAELAREAGLKNVLVTNGFTSKEALEELAKVVDAANVDLKSFSPEFYRRVCGGRLEPVLDSIRRYLKLGVWVEVTTLIIPGQNDSERELRGIAEFIAGLSRDVPWHVTRFHPEYRMLHVEATPVSTLRRAREIGREAGLKHVYIGNVLGEGEDTMCPDCGRVVIRRYGFEVVSNLLSDGTCPACGARIAGVWH